MINLLDPKFKISFKIIGIFCLIIAGLIYGEYCYVQGRFDQCIKSDGFLISDGEDYRCMGSEEILSKGYQLDKKSKTLVSRSIWSNNTLNWTNPFQNQ